ncbi:MAG: aldo/keto reductase [Pseudomonadota bacterium]
MPVHAPPMPQQLRLGFGTGSIGQGKDKSADLRLIAAALDAGITHFDTARLYGEGRAEGILGEALKGRRADVFLVSKAGIAPPDRSRKRRILNKGLAIAGKAPFLGEAMPQPVWEAPHFGQFGLAEVRASLEKSLRALNTDYLDRFLLHEADIVHLEGGALIDALEQWRKEGLFVGYGLASTRDQTSRILAEQSDAFATVQTSASVFDGPQTGFAAPGREVISHSWLGGPLARFHTAFKRDTKLAEKAGRCLYVDVRRPQRLAQCLLECALAANPGGQVLFSTRRVERITGFVRVAERPRMTAGQIASMKQVVARIRELEDGAV